MNDTQETGLVLFEAAILDEKEFTPITAELIREKSKPLTELTIANILDTEGYNKVKAAKNKAIKTRTCIERLEKAQLAEYKAEYDAKKKEVTDYTAGLYSACREVENALQGKLTAIDEAKEAEIKRLNEETRKRTEGREQKLFELGFTWNGQSYLGYGKALTRDYLFGLSDTAYDELLTELEGLQMEIGVTGEVLPAPEHPPIPAADIFKEREYPTAIFDERVEGLRIVLTKGIVEKPDRDAVLVNKRVAESNVYVQVVR